jgi:predicted DCC family thiol-disulfide oxidoreductase YuxK
MKNDHYMLIYDDGCPMCVAYTSLFVKTGFLKPEERKSFTQAGEHWLNLADFKRSRNEIPFVNTTTGKTFYGIDALLEILNRKIPFIKTIGNISFIKYLLLRLYKLISLNRKVIVGNKTKFDCVDCTPDYHFNYRFLFILLSFLFITVMLLPIHTTILSNIPFYKLSLIQLLFIHFGIVFANSLISSLLGGKKGMEYLGQMNMLALSAILLNLPLLLAHCITNLHYLIDVVYLAGVSMLLVFDYFRRIDFADLQSNKQIIAINLITFTAFIAALF